MITDEYCYDINNKIDCNYNGENCGGCISTTTRTATMIVETVVDVMSTENTTQIANSLILMEVEIEQHAHNNNYWYNKSIIAGSMQCRIDL